MHDPYTMLAAAIHNCEPQEVTPEQRLQAKRWWLAKQYSATQPLLDNNLNLVVFDEADELCPHLNRQP
jgi:hypothetical protein